MQLPKLNLPTYEFKYKQSFGKAQIFDEVRKKFVSLTPEEWVRQNLLQFLIVEKKYPASLIVIEQQIKYNKLEKRGDIVVYNKLRSPWLMVECKAPKVKLTQNVFDQIARYNKSLGVKYLMLSNGMEHYCCEMTDNEPFYIFLKEIPPFEEAKG